MTGLTNEILIFGIYVAMVLFFVWALKKLVCRMLGVTTYYPLSGLANWTILIISLTLPTVVITMLDALIRVLL
jgi:hypothetical protein